jgi:acetoin utilization deacetylase AcuC-like enzyme
MVLVINGPYSDSGHEEEGHPERPERLVAAMSAVADLHLGSDLIVAPSYSATRTELVRVHNGNYLDELGAFCYSGGGNLDQDTYATLDSWTIAKYAAGAGLKVIEELRHRGDGVGFIAARPPGHHALADRAMGFCLLNNVAIAAAELLRHGERVLIVDWDVHHGNGTQQIFWDEPDVLYVSTHQWPLFPGSGSVSEVGGRHATDRTVNIPLPPGATGDVVRRAIDEIAGPVVATFNPTWVLVSAGFDAHRNDPMADLCLTSGDFAMMTRYVMDCAPHPGRVVFFLEGGYDLSALRSSIHATLSTALGQPHETEAPSNGGPGTEQVGKMHQERRSAIEKLHASDDTERTQ